MKNIDDLLADDFWDNEAHNYFYSQGSGCWRCGSWKTKHAYLDGFRRGCAMATTRANATVPNDVWHVEAEQYHDKHVKHCSVCGGFYVKQAFVDGMKRGIERTKTDDYPFDELEAWINGETNDDN